MGEHVEILPKSYLWRKHILILVTLGTRAFQFDRLLLKLDELCKRKVITVPVVVQSVASSHTFDSFTCTPYFSAIKMHELMKKSDLIITHGGTGSITDALKLEKKVIGVPRLQKHGEHIDDHQLELISFFAANDYIIGIQDVNELEQALIKSNSFVPRKFISGNEKIKILIREFLERI